MSDTKAELKKQSKVLDSFDQHLTHHDKAWKAFKGKAREEYFNRVNEITVHLRQLKLMVDRKEVVTE